MQEEKGTTEDEMVGWPHRLDGHKFEQALGVGDGQGSLVCCSPWGRKELDVTQRLNNNKDPLHILIKKEMHFNPNLLPSGETRAPQGKWGVPVENTKKKITRPPISPTHCVTSWKIVFSLSL